MHIITYGTFDLFHLGHLNILKRAKNLGSVLTVGISTKKFNRIKNKKCTHSFKHRKIILQSLPFVDSVIEEHSWEQKEKDILKYKINILVMGDDWLGKFDSLNHLCKVIYLPRTPNVSTTIIKKLNC